MKGKDPKNLSTQRKETPEEFLLRKEKVLRRPITARFREFFYRELNGISNRTYEQVWESVFGRA
ncbi:hypothetical protein LEP1GSC051_2117 [Leptospira sp. P2653]|nr:hypothetical protein LEP1GSC051_2117 [Leptospira sp. P2653]